MAKQKSKQKLRREELEFEYDPQDYEYKTLPEIVNLRRALIRLMELV